tara:strand:- start:657 stop:848 length:192 start_codon:yes stop_codon:yes gene_type:complete
MEELKSKRWPIGLREFMDKDKDEVIDWEELHKEYEKKKEAEIRRFLIADRRSMSMRKERVWKK